MLRDTTGASLYHHVMGRAFRVVAVADTEAEANEHMERTPGASVIDCYAGLVIMADKEDKGREL
jgi:hypothetical protein